MREFKDEPAGVIASKLVTGDRQESYGDPMVSLDRIAAVWSGLLGVVITRRNVAHMMVALKLCRDVNKPGADNEVDICGYAHLLQFDREEQEYDDD